MIRWFFEDAIEIAAIGLFLSMIGLLANGFGGA